jgi:hypothetical protein
LSSNDKTPVPFVLPINPDDPEKSVRGRLSYIHALSQYVNGFWESLKDGVLYSCEFFGYLASGRPIPEGMLESAQVCFDRWLWDWEIVDEWLMDACQHTLQAWAAEVDHSGREALDNRHPLPVWYGPSESNLTAALSEFTPVFEQPYPVPLKPLSPEDRGIVASEPLTLRMYEAKVERESGADFKKRMRAQFDAQLATYTARCEALILEHENIERDAAWTALFQCGLTPKKIEAWEFNRSGDAFSHARIQQAVKKFANAIGLTLRKPKAGRNSKGKRAQIREL